MKTSRCFSAVLNACCCAAVIWWLIQSAAAAPVPQTDKLMPGPVGEPGALAVVDGNYALSGTGAYDFGTNSGGRSGVAVHDRTLAAQWPARKILQPPASVVDVSDFGRSFALDGDTAVVGSERFVFIYGRNQGGADAWGLVKQIDRGEERGVGLDVDGEVLVMQAVTTSGSSSVQVRRRNQGGTNQWGVVGTVLEPNPASGGPILRDPDPASSFGARLALSGAIFAAAGRMADGEKAIHLFRDGDGPGGLLGPWGLYRSLTKANIPGGALRLGSAFDWADGQLCVAGLRDISGTLGSWVYVLTPPAAATTGAWPQLYATSLSGGGELPLSFGCQVKTGANWMAVSRLFPNSTDSNSTDRRVYFYRASGGSWALETDRLVGPLPASTGGGFLFPSGFTPSPEENWLTQQVIGEGTVRSLACDGATCFAGRKTVTASFSIPESTMQVMERALGSPGWGVRANLAAAAPGAGGFGKSISIGRNFMAIGEPDDDELLENSGAVNIYVRDSGELSRDWRSFGRVKASDAATDMEFGAAVATDGNLLFVGAPGKDSDRGAVYVYRRGPSIPDTGVFTWREQAIIPGPVAGGRFGAALAMNRDNENRTNPTLDPRILIGAPAASMTGRVYIYRPTVPLDYSAWLLSNTHTGSDSANNSQFGAAVAFEGDTFAAGAWFQTGGGAVYVFRDSGTSWTQTKKITASDTSRGLIGISISLSEDRLAVGTAPAIFIPNTGGVFIYERNQGGSNNWGEVKKILPPADQVSWGLHVSLYKDSLLVGSPVENIGGSRSGAVSVRRRDQGGSNNWGEVRKLIATDTQPDDTFGSSVMINRSAVAISSPGSDSRGADVGAVYTYRFGSYEFWAGEEGLLPGQDGTEQDPDGDGQLNLLEFAFGSDPRDRQSVGHFNYSIVDDAGDKWLEATWFKPLYPTDELHVDFRGSRDLTNFGEYLRVTTDIPLLKTARAFNPVSRQPRYFTRMQPVYPYTQ